MAAYFFVDVLEITDQPKLEKYREGVFATVELYGGRYVILGGNCEVVEGDWRPTFPVMIEFSSLEQAKRWYASSEYEPLLKLRLESTRGNALFLDGR
jgi:uncharacterized protein (DUF1330 family)